MPEPAKSPTPIGPLAFLGGALGGLTALGARTTPLGFLGTAATCVVAGALAGWLARRATVGRFTPLFFATPGLLAAGACMRAGGSGAAPSPLVVVGVVGCSLALAVFLDRPRRASREGSLLDVVERRRGKFVACAIGAFVPCVVRYGGSVAGLAFTLAISLVIAAIVFTAMNAHALLEVTRLARGLVRAPEPPAGTAGTDFGVGDQSWVDVQASAPYRSYPIPARTAVGDFLTVHRAMAAGLIAEGATLLVLVALLALGLPLPPRTVYVSGPPAPAPAPTFVTTTNTVVSDIREAGWYPQRGPILADVNDDGVEDIVGVRWLYNQEDAGVTVMAVDGKTLRSMWRVTPSIPSQWASGRVDLRRSGDTLFLTDSEGLLHVLALKDGKRKGGPTELSPTGRMQCASSDAPPRVWLSRRSAFGDALPPGYLADDSGGLTDAPRPKWCDSDAMRSCDTPGPGACKRWDLPFLANPLPQEKGSWFSWREAVEEDGEGVAVGNVMPKGSYQSRPYLEGYDAKTKKVSWRGALTFTDEPMHEDASPRVEVQRGRVLGIYQLATGKWLVGARDGRTGEVLWSTEVPRAVHGTNFESMTVTDWRVYLALSSRLEVFDVANGKSLGVVW